MKTFHVSKFNLQPSAKWSRVHRHRARALIIRYKKIKRLFFILDFDLAWTGQGKRSRIVESRRTSYTRKFHVSEHFRIYEFQEQVFSLLESKNLIFFRVCCSSFLRGPRFYCSVSQRSQSSTFFQSSLQAILNCFFFAPLKYRFRLAECRPSTRTSIRSENVFTKSTLVN